MRRFGFGSCGYGVVGILAAKIWEENVVMLDIDEESSKTGAEECIIEWCSRGENHPKRRLYQPGQEGFYR